MGVRKTTTLEVAGEVFDIASTELVPGAWSWDVTLDGARLGGATRPEPSYHAAYFAALARLRELYPDRHELVRAGRGSQPAPGPSRSLSH